MVGDQSCSSSSSRIWTIFWIFATSKLIMVFFVYLHIFCVIFSFSLFPFYLCFRQSFFHSWFIKFWFTWKCTNFSSITRVFVCLFIYQSIYQSIYSSFYLFIYLFIYLFMYIYIYIYIFWWGKNSLIVAFYIWNLP